MEHHRQNGRCAHLSAFGGALGHRSLRLGFLPAGCRLLLGGGGRYWRHGAATALAELLGLLTEKAEPAETAVDHPTPDFHHLFVVPPPVAAHGNALVGLLLVHPP